MNSILKPEHDFEVEARRAIVTHDLGKLANTMLSDINIDNLTNIQCTTGKICRQVVSWKDNHFWDVLPNPNTYVKQKPCNNHKPFKSIVDQTVFHKTTEFLTNPLKSNQTEMFNNLELSKKYFEKWKISIKNRKDHRNRLNEQIVQKEKLENFLKMLKKCKSKNLRHHRCKTPIKLHYSTLENRDSSTSENSQVRSKSETKPMKPTEDKILESISFKHRFKAQQDIINTQKEKLIKQEKIIQELRLGKLSEEINQSIEETEKEIHETFTKCSLKVKCKVGSIPTETPQIQDNLINFHINSGKAPKIVHQMEKRALERENKRQVILERKRMLDREKKQAVEREIERKKVADEEERKRSLREIKERRRKQMEIQQQIQIKKQKFLENCTKADNLYRRKLIGLGFKGFSKLILIKKNNIIKSQEFYKMSLKGKGWKEWNRFILEIDYVKINKAEQIHNFKLKKKILKLWFSVYTINLQHLQVAEDLYEMKLQSNTFIHWHRYTCTQYVQQNKNIQKAHQHYTKRTLLHHFYKWKLLPVVMQLEKTKEEKKQRWREKVWEILPDYSPRVED